MIQSLRQSHIEPLELGQVRNLARQRAKLVVRKQESLHVFHPEQLGRHLRQTHAIKLTTMCELSDVQIIDSLQLLQRRAGPVSRRRLSSCCSKESVQPLEQSAKQTKQRDEHNDSQHTLNSGQNSNFKLEKVRLKPCIAHCTDTRQQWPPRTRRAHIACQTVSMFLESTGEKDTFFQRKQEKKTKGTCWRQVDFGQE